MSDLWENSLQAASLALKQLQDNHELIEACKVFAQDITQALQQSKKILICGNGGSHCDALHFAEEFTGRYRKNRRALPVLALGEASHTTCVSNDYGFEKVFSRQVEAFGQKGDVLICLSTSGKSPNILEALQAAKSLGVKTWAFLGHDGGPARALADASLLVPGETTDRIQELHMLILHVGIEDVERVLFPENCS